MDANNIMTDIPLHVYEPEEEDYSVYIVLSKTQTLPSRVIKLWTREPYAHTSLAMDVELKEKCIASQESTYIIRLTADLSMRISRWGYLGVMSRQHAESGDCV